MDRSAGRNQEAHDRNHLLEWRFSDRTVEYRQFFPHSHPRPHSIKFDVIRFTDPKNGVSELRNVEIETDQAEQWFQVLAVFCRHKESFHFDVRLRFDESFNQFDDCECAPRANRDALAATAQPGTAPPPHLYTTLCNDYAALFGCEETADVRFTFGDETLPAHECVLRCRVPYFERLFTSGMQEAETNVIVIQDAEKASFSHVLKFIYCAQLPTDMKTEAANLLPIANKYGIDELKQACAASLGENLRPENVVATLILADHHQCPDLRQRCVSQLTEWKDSVAEADFDSLKSYPDLLLEMYRNQ